MGPTRVSSNLAYKYKTWVEVSDSDEHSSLSRHEINYGGKKFYVTGPLLSHCFLRSGKLIHNKINKKYFQLGAGHATKSFAAMW
jgi:hypothetical protein